MDLGGITVFSLSDGFFRLDGGAMYGIIPKTLWSRVNVPDEKNRISLGMRPLLIEAHGKKILVNTGIGNKFDPKFQDIFSIDHSKISLLASLETHGVKPKDIDIVLLTHLHLDHAGWNTVRENDAIIPTFKNARYIVQKGEWDNATHTNERTAGSYRSENFIPIMDSGKFDFIEGDQEVMKGIRVEVSGGHTKFHQMVFIEGSKEKAIYWSDIMPTTNHLKFAYIMGYDMYPMETFAAKKKFVPLAAEQKAVCFWEHEFAIAQGRILSDGKEYRIEKIP